MKGISLFSGMGGDSLGMANAGVELVAYSEKERIFRETHDLNFPDCKVLGADVKSYNCKNLGHSINEEGIKKGLEFIKKCNK